MKPGKLFAAFMILMITATSVSAQEIRHDRKRIRQGVRSGELTRIETRRLASQQREIRRDVRAAKSDGVVTRAEKREVRKDKRKADRSIYRAKHNRRDRN